MLLETANNQSTLIQAVSGMAGDVFDTGEVLGYSQLGVAMDITEDAKKNLIRVATRGTTVPHEVIGSFGATRVMIKPAVPGTGVIAGGAARAVMEAAGISDVRTKSLRSNNPCNVVPATIEGLKQMKTAQQIAEKRGKGVKEILG